MAFVTRKRWKNKVWTTEAGSRGSRHALWGVPCEVALHEDTEIQTTADLDGDDTAMLGKGRAGQHYNLKGGARLSWQSIAPGAQDHPLSPFETKAGELDHLAEGGARLSCLRLARVPDDATWRHRLTLPDGCVLDYQPALTAEEDAEGSRRPDAVVGSYAIRDAAGCKIAHVLRPCAWDASGSRRIWGTIEIVDRVSTVRFDRAGLTDLGGGAVLYGLDTFGYTTAGASASYPVTNVQYGYHGYSSPADGNATSVWLYCRANAGYATDGVFSDSGGQAQSVLRDSASVALSSTLSWQEVTLDSSLSISSGATYHVGTSWSKTSQLNYDNVGSGQNNIHENITYSPGSLSNFSSPSSGNSWDQYSAYIEYTPSAAGGLVVPRCRRAYLRM